MRAYGEMSVWYQRYNLWDQNGLYLNLKFTHPVVSTALLSVGLTVCVLCWMFITLSIVYFRQRSWWQELPAAQKIPGLYVNNNCVAISTLFTDIKFNVRPLCLFLSLRWARALDLGRALPKKHVFFLPSSRIALLPTFEKKLISRDKKHSEK